MTKTTFYLETKLTFGIYKGLGVIDVLKINPKYLQWCVENVEFFDPSSDVKLMLADAMALEKVLIEDDKLDYDGTILEDYQIDGCRCGPMSCICGEDDLPYSVI